MIKFEFIDILKFRPQTLKINKYNFFNLIALFLYVLNYILNYYLNYLYGLYVSSQMST